MKLQNAVLMLALLPAAGLVAKLGTPMAYAQSNISGDIMGTVTDASGAALPDAQVTVTSVEKGQSKTVVADRVGNFHVPLLSPGQYKITVAASGFATDTAQVTVSAGTNSFEHGSLGRTDVDHR